MNKTIATKSISLLSTIFISSIVFGLFVISPWSDSRFTRDDHAGTLQFDQDTLQGRKINPQDSVFQAIMKNADAFEKNKEFGKAVAELEKASKLKPNQPNLRERITKLKGLANEQSKSQEESNKAMESGDGYFATRDYLNAKAAYQLAIDAWPENKTAKEKLQKTMELLRSQKAQNILFDVAVASADKLFQAGEYDRAKVEYENASKLLPGDPYPKNRINEIIKIQVDKKVKDDEYAKAIASGDKSFITNNLQLALLDYKKAAGIKPAEKYPPQRIKEINDLLAAQKIKDDAYNKAIAIADQFFQNTRYQEAVKSYKDALAVKPEQVYPKNRIAEAEGLIGRIKMTQYQYDKYLAAGDSLYVEKQYFKARENYVMASSVKPTESYPKEMISKADKMLTGQEAALAKALEEQYAKTIAAADNLLAQNSLESARAEYVKAGNLKPAENYPKEQVKAIDEKFSAALRNKDEAYQKAIASGDKALASRVLEVARSEYQAALAIKPAEAYPKAKLAEVDKLMALEAAQKAEDAKYTDAIATGDSLFFEKAYQPAKVKFQAALAMKPKEAYPRNRIAEIDAVFAVLEKEKAKEQQYSALIAKADKGFGAKQYQVAREDYTKASSIKPDEMYPREKIAELDRILGDIAASKAIDNEYLNLITQADKQFTAKAYPEAKTIYENAGKVKPMETYPAKKIAEIDKILMDIAARKSADENYQSLVQNADKLFAEKSYEPARESYLNAQKIKPAEQHPKTRIAEIDLLLGELTKKRAQDEEYTATIAAADLLLAANSMPEAKAKYQAALKIKPAESYPKEKIAGIDKILAEESARRSLDEKYNAAVKAGEDLLTKKSYQAAKNSFIDASGIKPEESYPKGKITEIDKILADLAAQKELDDQYKAAIGSADKAFIAKSYTDARVQYENALKLKPAETYPQTRIEEIGKIEAEIAAKKTLEENYQATITRADQLFASSNYETAKAEFGKAAELKPAEKYPKTRIAEIDAILAGIAKKNALEKEYADAIAEADQLLGNKSYSEAKLKFQGALKIKPGEKYPADKIAEIDKALADAARIKALDDQYQASIKKADELFGQKGYEAARTEYQKALTLKANEKYPNDKIAEIDKILADIAAAKELDSRYKSVIAGADQLFGAKQYDKAKQEYGNALKIKPEENYPGTRISEIEKILTDLAAEKKLNEDYLASVKQADQLLASKSYEQAKTEYEKAGLLKPSETYPKTKISEIDLVLTELARKKAIDEEYTATMLAADQLLADKSYEAAKTKYQRASELKASEPLPKTRIAECDKALSDVARLKAIEEQYKTTIAEADKLLGAKTYDKARETYTQAGKLKPAESYPGEKIREIDGILAAITKQKALDDQYSATITRADQQLTAKSYDQAKKEYNTALSLKPAETYPKDKIAAIDAILAELKAKEDAYKAAIASGEQLLARKQYEEARTEFQNALEIKPQDSYSKGKIAEITRAQEELMGKQKFYDNLIVDADKLFADRDYPKAKDTYQRASGVLPDQKYPKDRITLITAKLDSIYTANKSRYDKAVGDGDRFYNNYEYDKAIDAYTEAASLLPMEAYPRDMIVKIRRTIAENAIADVLKTSVTIVSNDEKQFSFTPVNFAARKNNFVYIKIRNLSGKPFNVLMRYGKDKQSNGGVVMRNITIDGKVNERLVSVRDQDLWSREDNNWISLIPQGGDVEVTFIQVSRARKD